MMYARFVRKGDATDDGLVRLDAETNNPGEQLAGGIELSSIEAGFKRQPIRAHPQGHRDLFQRSIPGALADSVNGAFNLSGPGIDRRQPVFHPPPHAVLPVHTVRSVSSFTHTPLPAP